MTTTTRKRRKAAGKYYRVTLENGDRFYTPHSSTDVPKWAAVRYWDEAATMRTGKVWEGLGYEVVADHSKPRIKKRYAHLYTLRRDAKAACDNDQYALRSWPELYRYCPLSQRHLLRVVKCEVFTRPSEVRGPLTEYVDTAQVSTRADLEQRREWLNRGRA